MRALELRAGTDEEIEADLCIVGTGAAGISLALQFLGSGLRVVLLEAGDSRADPETQALYEGETASEQLHPTPDRYRQRMFGGSTTIWGGRCIPFDPIDFEKRSWVPDSGWPISYDEVNRYYGTATALAEAGDFTYSARDAVQGGMRPMIRGFQPDGFTTDGIERFSCPTDFGARYRRRLEDCPNARILFNANCTEIVSAEDGRRIDHVVARGLNGGQVRVRARQVVLAVGGIETARLLLASRHAHPNGIGNEHDLVGRYYMCHIAGTIGELSLSIPRGDVWQGYQRAWDGVYCRRRIQPTADLQRELGIGNTVFRLHHPRLPDPAHRTAILSAIYFAKPFISYEYSKRLHGSETAGIGTILRHAANIATGPVSVAEFLIGWAWKRTLAARKFPSLIIPPKANLFSFEVNAEQCPNPASCIGLSADKDALGLRRVRVDWNYLPQDIATVARGLEALQARFSAWGGGRLRYAAEEVETAMTRDGALGGHHIGTARMALSPETGVVDTDCRVFGVDNLYIAGSAVFPTSSQANPTLTIIAMALRLAAHLHGRLNVPAGHSVALEGESR